MESGIHATKIHVEGGEWKARRKGLCVLCRWISNRNRKGLGLASVKSLIDQRMMEKRGWEDGISIRQ
jgi:hypothetical protein